MSERDIQEFTEALGAEVGGHIEGNRWTCSCGKSGEHLHAALALYFHRRSGHQDAADVLVESWPT